MIAAFEDYERRIGESSGGAGRRGSLGRLGLAPSLGAVIAAKQLGKLRGHFYCDLRHALSTARAHGLDVRSRTEARASYSIPSWIA
jgi:hypothetical protein